jgi:hypothetical protein
VTERDDVGDDVGRHAAYVAQGGLAQASTLFERANHEYLLKVTLLNDGKHAFSGCRLSLVSGTGSGRKTLATAEFPYGTYTTAELKAGVVAEVGFIGRDDVTTDPIRVVVERMYAGNTWGEKSLLIFDDVTLCARSNECGAVYPQHTQSELNVVALVDVSGSIDRKQAALSHAVRTVALLHQQAALFTPVAPLINAALFVFQSGSAVQVWLVNVLLIYYYCFIIVFWFCYCFFLVLFFLGEGCIMAAFTFISYI